tara:strand:+ start:561 stop:737 length:177 start_codon:yes stop_codon:yes gene_type:complete
MKDLVSRLTTPITDFIETTYSPWKESATQYMDEKLRKTKERISSTRKYLDKVGREALF